MRKMTKPFVININLDAKCKRCGKGGATQNGLCMTCITKAFKAGEFDHIIKSMREKVKKESMKL
jgi:hypothetical protein